MVKSFQHYEYNGEQKDYKPKKSINESNLKDRLIQKIIGEYYAPKHEFEFILQNILELKLDYFKYCFNLLEDINSKETLIELVTLKICGSHKIKLSIENEDYKKYHEDVRQLENKEKTIKTNFRNFILTYFDLDTIKVFGTTGGIVTVFKQEQYSNYENKGFC